MDLRIVLLTGFLILSPGCLDDGDDDDGSDGLTDGQDDGMGNETVREDVTLQVGLSGAYPITIAYDPETLEVPAGANVTLTFTNNDQTPAMSHDWVLEGFEATASTQVVGNGESSTITFIAPEEPGDYAFYCSVPGHRGNGMEGTLTVTAAAGGNETASL